MDPRLQRRVQRYGWDKAVGDYEAGWRTQLEPAQSLMLDMVALQPGEQVLDVACGTGLVSFRIRDSIGEDGTVVGTDISGEMIEMARRVAAERRIGNIRFERCDAEDLKLDCEPFDAAVCALGLMYVPNPVKAVEEMRRLLKPGGRIGAAIWGARAKCGWAEIFPITDARVASEVCPMFFHLGTGDMLTHCFAEAGCTGIRAERLQVNLVYATDDDALGAAFRGGPVALAYNRFDDATKQAVHAEYLNSIADYRIGEGYEIPGEFVAVVGTNPSP